MMATTYATPRTSQAWHDGKIVIVMLYRCSTDDWGTNWEYFLIHPWNGEGGPCQWVPIDEVTFR